jgi:predicted CXXCH cytochrome family protein
MRGSDPKEMKRFAAGFLLVALLAGCAGMEARKPAAPSPEERYPDGKIRGLVAVGTGVSIPLEGVTVTAGGLKTSTDAGGRFFFPSLSRGKHSVVADKQFATGGVRRAMGVSVIYVNDPDSPVQVGMTLRDATFVDRFCAECHPYRGQPVLEGQVLRDVHVSGVVPKKARKSPESWDEKGRITCLSCHTPHEKSSYEKFLTGLKTGPLCQKCH